MNEVARFPFADANLAQPGRSLMPLMPLVLSKGGRQKEAVGLLDTGAAVNVMPFSLGQQLGFLWDEQKVPVVLSGNLSRQQARGVIVSAAVGQFAPIRLAFAWTQSHDVPLLLGQMNFFLEFDVCFFRTREEFEVRLKLAK
jgi:hypothetical protein